MGCYGITIETFKGRYVCSWGGRARASEGRVISESEYQKGRAIPHVSYSREGHTSFPKFFNENFCDVAFHFSYSLSFPFHLPCFNLEVLLQALGYISTCILCHGT